MALTQRVHGLPEARVAKRRELALGRQALHRLALPDRVVALDVVPHAGLEDEEPAIDPGAVALRLLAEAADAAVVDLQRAEAPGGRDRGHRGQSAAGAVVG